MSTRAADDVPAAAVLETGERRLSNQPPSLRRTLVAILILMRPRQWIKNLLVLAAPLFASRLFEGPVLRRTLLALVAFCAASSATYVYNDLRDAAVDRLHPLKSRRPVAAGLVTPGLALAVAGGCLVVAVLVGLVAGPRVAALVGVYGLLMLGYCELGRSWVTVDVFIISAGFLLRALAGAAAGPVPASPWFLALTLLLALMLGFGKRRAEVSLLGAGEHPARSSLATYSVPMLDQLLSVLAASIIVLYAIYAVSITTRIGSSDMILTWPLVLFGVIRYLQVSHITARPPDELLVTDRAILGVVLTYGAIVAIVLHFHTHLISPVSLG